MELRYLSGVLKTVSYMKKWEKLQNIIGAVVFGTLGLGSLAGFIFAGALHQLLMVAICSAMVAALVAEINWREKSPNNTALSAVRNMD